MTKRKIGGYKFREEVNRAMNANKAARRAIQRILEEFPSPTQTAMLISKASVSIAESYEALVEVEKILIDIEPQK